MQWTLWPDFEKHATALTRACAGGGFCSLMSFAMSKTSEASVPLPYKDQQFSIAWSGMYGQQMVQLLAEAAVRRCLWHAACVHAQVWLEVLQHPH